MIAIENIILAFSRTLLLILGFILTFTSFRAYLRTEAIYLRDSTIGFGIITIGVFIEGILFEVGSFSLVFVHIIESLVIALGLIVLLISLKH